MFKTAKIRYLLAVPAVAFAAFGVAACGANEEGSAEPAVQVASPDKAQDEAAQKAQAAAEAAQAQVDQLEKKLKKQQEQANSESPAPAPATAPEPAGAPDVVGLTLPAATRALSDAGFKADVSNTDTTFGILVPRNYTVCTQDDPRGNLVPILAQKYGC